VRILVSTRFPNLLRMTLGAWVLFLVLVVALSLRISDLENLSYAHLELNGGMLGVFLVRQVVEPLFGPSRVGPAVLCSLCGLLTLIVAFGLRPSHIAPVWQNLLGMFRGVRHSMPTVTLPVRNTQVPSAPLQRNEDTSDFPVLRRGQVRPFDAESGKLKTIPAPVASRQPATPPVLDELSVPASMHDRNAAIRHIEAILLKARDMDPREVRRLRDELADLRRVSELNNWEDRKAGELRIEGIVKPSPQTTGTLRATEVHTALPPTQPHRVPPLPEAEPVFTAPIQWPVHPEPHTVEAVHEDPFSEPSGEYRIPKVGAVLGDVPEQPVDYSQDELKQFGAMLEQQLENFRVKGKVVHITTGPVITRFEIEPGPGVKVSRFAGLSDDLALALKASSIRVLAPIPGKSVVGIEIPNRKAQTVFCREILESPRFLPDPYTLQIVLGKDIMGNAFVMDLARAPHLLIAGQTGSGKSVCINALMASLLFSKSPDDLRMILIDPKVVELKSYEKIPHLLHPVVTDPGTAVQALQWACYEMDRRYELLAKAGVRNISGFNQKVAKGELESIEGMDPKDCQRMPFIVIIVDEFADVIMQAKKEFEDPVIRLAQKARAAGMHMVLATQRPSTNVITGIIKANLPTRISFKVASHIDARTVLDHAGAEKLLGRGDMLFRSIDDPEPIRVHGAFLTDDDAERVAGACSEQDVQYPQLTSFQVGSPEGEDSEKALEGPAQDELFWDAAELCALQGGGSTSLLQRRFSIGYSRAGRIMDNLYKAGIVGPERGSKPRECLMSTEEIAQIRRTRGV